MYFGQNVNRYSHYRKQGFPGRSVVKNLPAKQETWVQSMGWEDPLEKRLVTHSIFWPEEFHGLYSPWGCKEWDMTE